MEPLFETVTHYTYGEMRRYENYALRSIYYYHRLVLMMVAGIAVGFVVMVSGAQAVGIVLMLGAVIGILLRIIVTLSGAQKRIMGSPMFDKTVTLRFYDDHLTKEHDNNHTEFSYTQIQNIHEAEQNFYIVIRAVGGIIVSKKNCSEELASFLRGLNTKHT